MIARRFASLCAAAALAGCEAPPRQVSDSGYGAYEVNMATRPGDAGLESAWFDARDGNAEIYTRLLDASASAEGADRRLTQTPTESFEPDVATTADGYVIAWYEKTAEGAQHAQLGAWTIDGAQRWKQPLGSSERDTRIPLVRAFRDGLFAAWLEVDESGRHFVWGQWRNLDGSARSAPQRLAPAGPTTWNLNAAIDSRGVPFVVFDALVDTKAQELFLVEVAAGGPVVTRLGADDGHDSQYPDIAFSASDEVALTWFDTRDGNDEVYLAGGSLAGAPRRSRQARAPRHRHTRQLDRRVPRVERGEDRPRVVRRQPGPIRDLLPPVRGERRRSRRAEAPYRQHDELADTRDRGLAGRLRARVERRSRRPRAARTIRTRARKCCSPSCADGDSPPRSPDRKHERIHGDRGDARQCHNADGGRRADRGHPVEQRGKPVAHLERRLRGFLADSAPRRGVVRLPSNHEGPDPISRVVEDRHRNRVRNERRQHSHHDIRA